MNFRGVALAIILIILVLVFVLAIRDGVNPFGNLTLMLSIYAIIFSLGEFKRKIIAKAKPAHKRTSKSEPFRQEFTPAGQWIFLLDA